MKATRGKEPTIEVVAMIDERIILNRIVKEWRELSDKALKEVADQLEKKYFYEIGYYESDGIWGVEATPELKKELGK